MLSEEDGKRKKLYAASKNKDPILQILKPRLEALLVKDERTIQPIHVLEVASGTGEHASYFLENISSPHLVYQCTEYDESMTESITAWIEETRKNTASKLLNPIIPLDISNWQQHIPQIAFSASTIDAMICINMIHISPWICTVNLFSFASHYLRDSNSFLLTYGPYSVNGEMVESNHAFDRSLKERNVFWGVRDVEEIKKVAAEVGIILYEMIPMPSNNYCLIWKKRSS